MPMFSPMVLPTHRWQPCHQPLVPTEVLVVTALFTVLVPPVTLLQVFMERVLIKVFVTLVLPKMLVARALLGVLTLLVMLLEVPIPLVLSRTILLL